MYCFTPHTDEGVLFPALCGRRRVHSLSRHCSYVQRFVFYNLTFTQHSFSLIPRTVLLFCGLSVVRFLYPLFLYPGVSYLGSRVMQHPFALCSGGRRAITWSWQARGAPIIVYFRLYWTTNMYHGLFSLIADRVNA